MKALELRSKSTNELKDMLLALRKEAFNIRFQVANGQLENLSRKKIVRRDIARIKTIITENLKDKHTKNRRKNA